MSQMSTEAVLKCRRCGRFVRVVHLSTTGQDPHAVQLRDFMRNLHRIAMCDYCKHAYNYYASQGRSNEFLLGREY